jgi:hypothetical protein
LKERSIEYTLITLSPSYENLSLDAREYGANMPDEEIREEKYKTFFATDILEYSFYDNS